MVEFKKKTWETPGGMFGALYDRNPAALPESIPTGCPERKSQHKFLEQSQYTYSKRVKLEEQKSVML